MANDCERYGQGYWKQWLAENDDYVCPDDDDLTAEVLLGMLNTPARGDANQILLYQFIAASLNVNVEECVPPLAVIQALEEAGAHLEALKAGEESDATRDDILGWKDILEFWNENEYAGLESAVYEGTCTLFGSHADDTMTFTFSNDIYQDGELIMGAYFEGGNHYRIRSAAAVMDWEIDGNVLTVTANDTFSTPRDYIGAYVIYFEGLVDFIGNDVVVDEDGVEVTAGEITYPTTEYSGTFNSTRDVPGTWSYDITIARDCESGDIVWAEITLEDPYGVSLETVVEETKEDYAYWLQWNIQPNIAALGTATYSGYEGNFMFLFGDNYIQMLLSGEPYGDVWAADDVWTGADRDYDIWASGSGFMQ